MDKFACPTCGKGRMILETISSYSTKLGGIQVVVDDAKVSKCSVCGEISVSARELKRWRALQRNQLTEGAHVPRATDVRLIREKIGLSISSFASLLGVTRQTVHAWERPEGTKLPLGPAALLLKLIDKELREGISGCLDSLQNLASGRGQAVERIGSTHKLFSQHILRQRPRSAPGFACD